MAGLAGRNLLVGGSSVCNNPVLLENHFYRAAGGTGGGSSDFYLGYTAGAANAVVTNNYFSASSLFSCGLPGLVLQNHSFSGTVFGLNPARYPATTFAAQPPVAS